MLIEGLEQGYVEHDGDFVQQPRREIRPRPEHSFKGRTYAAAVSPEGMPLMAQLGIGLLVIPQKPWEIVEADFAAYQGEWVKHHTAPPPHRCRAVSASSTPRQIVPRRRRWSTSATTTARS